MGKLHCSSVIIALHKKTLSLLGRGKSGNMLGIF